MANKGVIHENLILNKQKNSETIFDRLTYSMWECCQPVQNEMVDMSSWLRSIKRTLSKRSIFATELGVHGEKYRETMQAVWVSDESRNK
ncbi:hypothetical protein HZS_6238 [Henneguya salminicola]|nr:hypothetical protein HZS_6238 [Henneguya salminicola]